MRRHLERPRIGDLVRNGVNALLAARYSDNKYKFKKKYFSDLGGFENEATIRETPPPNMDPDEWSQLVDFYMNDKRLSRSQVNSRNRRNQSYPSYHGSRSYVEYRHQQYLSDPNRQYPSLISAFANYHQRNGVFTSDVAQQQYETMRRMWNEQANNPNPLSEEQIMAEVLGTRRGHNKGRGRIVRGSSSLAQAPPMGQTYTQADFEAMSHQIQTQAAYIQQLADFFRSQGMSVPNPPSQAQYAGNDDDDDNENQQDENADDESDD